MEHEPICWPQWLKHATPPVRRSHLPPAGRTLLPSISNYKNIVGAEFDAAPAEMHARWIAEPTIPPMSSPAVPTRRLLLGAWLPVVVWAAVIFAFSSVPSLSTELGTADTILRKLAHLTEYAILGALLCRAVRRPAVAVAIATLYAVTDEVHQTFVGGRHGAPLDVGIDALGAIVGVLLWHRLVRRDARAP